MLRNTQYCYLSWSVSLALLCSTLLSPSSLQWCFLPCLFWLSPPFFLIKNETEKGFVLIFMMLIININKNGKSKAACS